MRNLATKTGLVMAAAVTAAIAPALAGETVKYSYDAKGRLVKVERSGIGSDVVKTDYKHDKADNRTRVIVAGSSNPPPPPP